MIRRLYVDNFRSLVDFTWELGKETLVLGYNGSGKTSALEVISVLQRLCTRSERLSPEDVYEERTTWTRPSLVRIELDVELSGTPYQYRIEIGLAVDGHRPSIVSEALNVDRKSVFSRIGQRVQMITVGEDQGIFFPVAGDQSVVAIIGADLGGEAVVPFREYLQRILYLKPIPFFMGTLNSSYQREPEAAMSYLIPWYVYLSEDPSFESVLTEYLKDVWPELQSVQTPERTPDVRDLVFEIQEARPEKPPSELPFNILSDGEKVLVGLYVVAAYQKTHRPTTIIIDEPDNYVSLLEIQPWLLRLLDERPDDGQIIIVSHNEEIIRTFGREKVAYFSRKDHLSPTSVRGIGPEETNETPLRDLLRRGWLDE